MTTYSNILRLNALDDRICPAVASISAAIGPMMVNIGVVSPPPPPASPPPPSGGGVAINPLPVSPAPAPGGTVNSGGGARYA